MTKKIDGSMFEILVSAGADPAVLRGKIVSGEIGASVRFARALDADKAVEKAIGSADKAIDALAVSSAFDSRAAVMARMLRDAINMARNYATAIETAHAEAIEEDAARKAA